MKRFSLTPSQSLAAGFFAMVLLGTVLLMLPAALAEEKTLSLVDAFFTATSAVTTTGLVVVDTGSYFSLFGQIVILVLMQVGGLGYMIFIALIVLGLGRKLSLSNRILLHESMARPTTFDIRKFVKVAIVFTLLFELAGAAFYTLFWMNYYPLPTAMYSAVFHSVSGFCTAGFSLYADSFMRWGNSTFFNIVTNIIWLGGTVGFFVLYDMYMRIKKSVKGEHPRHLLAHTKFVLSMTLILGVVGSFIIFIAEKWPETLSLKDKLFFSVFQAMTASTTTGFNTLDIGSMNVFSLLVIILLMSVGGSPGSTAGGIKTTTFGLIILFLVTFFKGEEDVQLFRHRVSYKIINRAFAITAVALLWLMLVSALLTFTEKASFVQILFEVASALGTTGLSTGITASLSLTGKVLISLTMLVGRLGPVVIGYSLVGKMKPTVYRSAKAEILVG